MKITYIHQHFRFPEEGGGQRPWQFAKRLAADGHDVTVLCGGSKPLKARREGVKVHRLSAHYHNSMSNARRVLSFLTFMVRSSRLAAKIPADVAFASSTPLTAAIPGIVAHHRHRARFVFEVRDLWPGVPIALGEIQNPLVIAIAKRLERSTYRDADHVVALSPGMEEGVLDVDRTVPTTVIPNASDIEDFASARETRADTRRALGWAENETVLMYAGNLGRSHDVPWIMDLAEHLQDHSAPVRIVICGDGGDAPRLRERAMEIGLPIATTLPGKLPKPEIARMLAAADYAVSTLADSPALEVNSLNKVFDALAAGTPVLFNHEGWLPDVLEEADAGIKLGRDPAEAAKTVASLVTDTTDADTRETAALKLAEAEFSRESMYDKFQRVLVGADTESR